MKKGFRRLPDRVEKICPDCGSHVVAVYVPQFSGGGAFLYRGMCGGCGVLRLAVLTRSETARSCIREWVGNWLGAMGIPHEWDEQPEPER